MAPPRAAPPSPPPRSAPAAAPIPPICAPERPPTWSFCMKSRALSAKPPAGAARSAERVLQLAEDAVEPAALVHVLAVVCSRPRVWDCPPGPAA